MRAERRWAPWAAPWDEEKKKYGKVPHRADSPQHGLSNGSTRGWVSFDEALAALRARPDLFAGIGYLMTGKHGVVGVDLDHCVDNGVVADWAAEIVAELGSYTELSPSGTGLHVFVRGDLEKDWSAKLNGGKTGAGIDVYGGGARFLTVTGAVLPDSAADLAETPEALAAIAKRYRKSVNTAELHVMPPPDVYHLTPPSFYDLNLRPKVVEFLESGIGDATDRSNLLIMTAAALADAGLSAEMSFALMRDNDHVWDICLDKRHYDDPRALEYLWTHQARRGAAIIAEKQVHMLDSFSVLVEEAAAKIPPKAVPSAPAQTGAILDDFDNISGELSIEELVGGEPSPISRDLSPQGKLRRFQFENLTEFLSRPAPTWIIKGLLPQAQLAVLYGASGSGKTFFALDVAMCVALGRPWRDIPVAQGGVAYVVAEGAGGFRDRIQAYCRQHDLDPATVPLHVLKGAPNMMQNPDVAELTAEMKQCGPLSVVVMDTYARVMGNGNENEAQDVNRVVRNCALLAEELGVLVVLVHHTGKDESAGARGSSALRAAVDAEIGIARSTKHRTATVAKMKDGEDGAEYRFKLETIAIGLDADGEERTSCIVEHLAAPTVADVDEKKAPKQNTVEARILDQLGTYLGGDVEFHAFCDDVRTITPLPASGIESPNWKALITRPLRKMIERGEVVEVQGMLSLPKTAGE